MDVFILSVRFSPSGKKKKKKKANRYRSTTDETISRFRTRAAAARLGRDPRAARTGEVEIALFLLICIRARATNKKKK